MGKGDRKSRKGKISQGSFGVRRKRKKEHPVFVKKELTSPRAVVEEVPVVVETKPKAKPKAAPKAKTEEVTKPASKPKKAKPEKE